MPNRFLSYLIFCCSLVLTTQTYSQSIEANNSLSPLRITTTDIIAIAINHPGSTESISHDWWIAVVTSLPSPDDIYYFNGNTWTTEFSVAFQQPLTETSALELLNGSGLPVGTYTFYFGTDAVANGELDSDSLAYDSIVVVSELAVAGTAESCGNSRQLFSVDPLESDAYNQIDPLGATNPSGHTFPTAHTYMMLQDNTQARIVRAPAAIEITQINVVENLTGSGTNYSLNFTTCPEVRGYFDHLSTLNQTLQDQLVSAGNCQHYVAGTDEYRFCSHPVSVDIAAGAALGTAGGGLGQLSAALDFGLRDSRIAPLFFSNPERLVNSDQRHVVCPYDYYLPGPVKAGLDAKLRVTRQDLPVCGTVALDVAETAQGRWYLQGTTDFGENDHLALVPSNKQPLNVGVLSVGNSDVGIDAYFFDFQPTGSVNRQFSEISAGSEIYCWENLRNRESTLVSGNAQATAGILFLEMTGNSSLTLQRSTALNLCPADTSSLSFDGSAIQFER